MVTMQTETKKSPEHKIGLASMNTHITREQLAATTTSMASSDQHTLMDTSSDCPASTVMTMKGGDDTAKCFEISDNNYREITKKFIFKNLSDQSGGAVGRSPLEDLECSRRLKFITTTLTTNINNMENSGDNNNIILEKLNLNQKTLLENSKFSSATSAMHQQQPVLVLQNNHTTAPHHHQQQQHPHHQLQPLPSATQLDDGGGGGVVTDSETAFKNLYNSRKELADYRFRISFNSGLLPPATPPNDTEEYANSETSEELVVDCNDTVSQDGTTMVSEWSFCGIQILLSKLAEEGFPRFFL
jgi:hypothetical protein